MKVNNNNNNKNQFKEVKMMRKQKIYILEQVATWDLVLKFNKF